MKKELKNIFISLLLFLSTLLLYIHHLTRGVFGGDVGDFTSAVATRGVPHPSGYPLLTLFGIVFSYLPVHEPLVFKVGLVSAIAASLTVVVVYLLTQELVKNIFISIVTACTLAFAYPIWLYAEMPEVFSLLNFFTLFLIYMSVKFYRTMNIRYLYILSLAFGISLTNNQMIIFVIPSVLLLVVLRGKNILLRPSVILKCIVSFCIGLLFYLYIPIAASYQPAINWDNASNIKNFIALVLRRDYGWSYIHATLSEKIRFLQIYLYFMTAAFPLICILTICAGIITFIRKKDPIFYALLLAYFFFGPFFMFYWAFPYQDSYRLGAIEKFANPSFAVLILFFPLGITVIAQKFLSLLASFHIDQTRKKIYMQIFTALFLLIPVFLFSHNVRIADLHTNLAGNYFARDILFSLPPNSIVVSSDDNTFLDSRYIRYVNGERTDITIHSTRELSDILEPNFLQREISKNNYFVQFNNYFSYMVLSRKPLPAVPYGLLFKVATDADLNMPETSFIQQQEKILKNLYIPHHKNLIDDLSRYLTTADIPLIYTNAYSNTGFYLMIHYNDYEKAKPYFQSALALYPDSYLAYQGLTIYYLNKKDCKSAKENFKKVAMMRMNQQEHEDVSKSTSAINNAYTCLQ